MAISRVAFLMTIVFCSIKGIAQTPPSITFSKRYGGSNDDHPSKLLQLADKSYLFCGWTFSNDGDITGFHGTSNPDGLLARVDSAGDLLWLKAIGGSGHENVVTAVAATDNTFIIAGKTTSTDGDFAGFSGPPSQGFIAWVNATTGNIRRVIPYTGTMAGNGVRSLAMVGKDKIAVYGQKVSGAANSMYLTVMDTSGSILWEKAYGTGIPSVGVFMGTMSTTADSGYILTASVQGNGGDVSGAHGTFNVWLVRLDDTGKIEWAKCYGGSGVTMGYCASETSDGSFICTGYTQAPNDSDVLATYGGTDYWIFKVNDTGKLTWSTTLGGSQDELPFDAVVTCDNGIIVAGTSLSGDGHIVSPYGLRDIFVVRLDSAGEIEWKKNYGTSSLDGEPLITTTRDNGYAMLAFSGGTDYDGSGVASHGFADIWLIKLASDALANWCTDTDTSSPTGIQPVQDNDGHMSVSVFPNPAGNTLNIHLSDASNDGAMALCDMLGRAICSTTIPAGVSDVAIPLIDVAPGVYLLNVTIGMERIAQRVTIVKGKVHQ